jgi:hypothetical protein
MRDYRISPSASLDLAPIWRIAGIRTGSLIKFGPANDSSGERV